MLVPGGTRISLLLARTEDKRTSACLEGAPPANERGWAVPSRMQLEVLHLPNGSKILVPPGTSIQMGGSIHQVHGVCIQQSAPIVKLQPQPAAAASTRKRAKKHNFKGVRCCASGVWVAVDSEKKHLKCAGEHRFVESAALCRDVWTRQQMQAARERVKSSTHVRIVADAKRALASMLSSLNFPTPKEREVLLQKDFLPPKKFTTLVLRSWC
jgi:hypothetical protein